MLYQLQQTEQTIDWKHCDWQRFWVLQELYHQQDIMHRDGRKRIDDRIVKPLGRAKTMSAQQKQKRKKEQNKR